MECTIAQAKNIGGSYSDKYTAERVKNDSTKDNIFSKLWGLIIAKDNELLPGSIIRYSDNRMIKKYAGKIIRKIDIDVLDVFGASVDNPNDSLRSWLQDRGNNLHMKTKEWLIKNKLIFVEGQRLTPFDIKESERIIRLTPYIYDVRIVPKEIKNNKDSVDIIIYTQDIWSANGSFSYYPGSKTGSVSFNDLNFLGFGNDFKGGLKIDPGLSHGWDWDGSYTIDNIYKSFLSANVYYLSEMNRQQYGIMIGRDFFSPIIRWAGAIAQNWQITRYPDLRDSLKHFETAKYNQQDYWLGYAFDLEFLGPNSTYQNRFNIAGRIIRTVYAQKPVSDTLNLYQDNTLYLGRIGFSYRTYIQDYFIFGLGRTEDIPIINMAELLFGFEKGSNLSRPYYGLKTGYSFYDDYFGYLYGGFQIGAFLSNKKWLNRNSILEILYFSNLNAIGNYYWRHYIGSRYSYSYDPLRPQNILDINNINGLRGFSDDQLKGNKKLVLNYEADIFVPFKVLGFKLAFIFFSDFGLISSINNTLFASKLYQGYGVGFRIKNEHLIFPTFQFMFALYPNLPLEVGKHFSMFEQNSIYYQFNKFQFSMPSVVSVN
ncbi:MAG: hypothetical protein Q8903_09865 [Bacteroidota bacterium]|nr:hypothetical protein [Bacteroidota bacterium]